MDKIALLTAALLVVAVIIVFLPPERDPAIRIKDRQTRSDPGRQERRDCEAIRKGVCPDCGSAELLGGPSGGMSQNVLCNHCLSEFNVHSGFGTGAFRVDRNGRAGQARAAIFGIDANEFREIEDRLYREALS